jgi:phosphate transport system protein
MLLRNPDEDEAHDVVAGAVGALNTREDIESAVERVMALQSPVARDLRLVLAVALVAYHIERVAANAGRIARLTLDAPPPLAVLPTLQDMGVEGCRAMRSAIRAFASGDPEHNIDLEGAALRLHDDERKVIERVASMTGDSATTGLLAARYLARVGEHASAIGQRTANVALGRPDLELGA